MLQFPSTVSVNVWIMMAADDRSCTFNVTSSLIISYPKPPPNAPCLSVDEIKKHGKNPDSEALVDLDVCRLFGYVLFLSPTPEELDDAVGAKKKTGFDTSLTGIWYVMPVMGMHVRACQIGYRGCVLSYQMFNVTNGGVSYPWSSIANTTAFQDGLNLMPFVVADGHIP
jgi:hypothetical protein